MSLWIEVYVGSRTNRIKVAETHAWNISNLADISDFEFEAVEYGAKHLGIPASEVKGKITKHYRKQSVWDLVAKIARQTRERLSIGEV